MTSGDPKLTFVMYLSKWLVVLDASITGAMNQSFLHDQLYVKASITDVPGLQ